MSTTIRNMILLTTIAIMILSCSSDSTMDDSTNPQPIVSETYEPCCGLESVTTYEFLGNKIYVPNVFTPNGDGINDTFYPFFTNDSIVIQAFGAITPEESKARLLYSTNNLITATDQEWAWDGKNYNSALEIDEYEGYFKYKFFAIIDGVKTEYYEGYACVIRCTEEAKAFQSIEGCLFGTQYNEETGEGDRDIPHGEEECIGE